MKKLYTLALAAFGFAAMSFGQYDLASFEVSPINIFSTGNAIEVAADLNETMTYSVVNLTGQVVAKGDFNSFVSVPTAGMNNGIYIVNVTNGTEVKTIKVYLLIG